MKVQMPGEQACLVKLCKSLVSAVDIPAGTVITREMLTTKVTLTRTLGPTRRHTAHHARDAHHQR